MYNRETFVFTVFRRVFHSILKLELCRHACRRRDQIIPTCRYGKNMPTTALVHTILSLLTYTKDPNFPLCGIFAKITEMRYKAENNILNKNEQNHVLKSPQNKFDKYLLNTARQSCQKDT